MDLDWAELSGSHVSRRTLLKFAGGGAAAFGLAACGAAGNSAGSQGSQAGGKPKRGGTLTAAWNISAFTSLDPQLMVASPQMSAMVNVLEGLVRLTPALDIEPSLAKSWNVSSDGLTYTFHLRQGVKWHNGDDFTAHDMVFTFNRGIKPSLGSPSVGQLGSASHAEAPDDLTVVFHLTKPYAPFLAEACTGMPGRILSPVNERALNQLGATRYGLTPVGTGPFKITAHQPGTSLTLSRFDQYWDKRYPLLDEVKIQLIPDVSTVQSALQSGDVQFADELTPESVLPLKGGGTVIVSKTGPNWWGLWLNYKSPGASLLADHRVRLAFAKALDREALVSKALFGQGRAAYGPLGPGIPYFYNTAMAKTQTYDLNGAKKLISEANAKGAKVQYMTNATSQRADQIIAEMLSSTGVDVSLDLVDTTTYSARGYTSGNYEMLHSGAADKPNPDFLLYNWFFSKGAYNTYSYSNPKVDALIQQERSTQNRAQRRQIFWELQNILINDVACPFTYYTNDISGMGKAVQGFTQICGMSDFRSTWLS